MFLLTYYCGFTYQDVRSMPLAERSWFVGRLVKEFNEKNSAAEQTGAVPLSRGAHTNTPEMRQMAGMTRTNPPARGRRFT